MIEYDQLHNIMTRIMKINRLLSFVDHKTLELSLFLNINVTFTLKMIAFFMMLLMQNASRIITFHFDNYHTDQIIKWKYQTHHFYPYSVYIADKNQD